MIKMCTELLLAILYFSTIFFVNFFLYKLLRSYYKEILRLLKLKKIFSLFPNDQILFNMTLFLQNMRDTLNNKQQGTPKYST
jgi:hypothetical protein